MPHPLTQFVIRDWKNFGIWKNLEIGKNLLYLKTDAVNLCSELYIRGSNKEISTLETIIAKEGKWKKLSDELSGELYYRIYEDNNHSKYTDYNPKIHKCVEKKTTLEVTLNFYPWLNNCVINSNYPIYKDDRGRKRICQKRDEKSIWRIRK